MANIKLELTPGEFSALCEALRASGNNMLATALSTRVGPSVEGCYWVRLENGSVLIAKWICGEWTDMEETNLLLSVVAYDSRRIHNPWGA